MQNNPQPSFSGEPDPNPANNPNFDPQNSYQANPSGFTPESYMQQNIAEQPNQDGYQTNQPQPPQDSAAPGFSPDMNPAPAADPYYADYNSYNPDPYNNQFDPQYNPAQDNNPNVDTAPATPEEAQAKPKGNRGNMIFYIIAGVCIVALLGALGFFTLQLQGNSSNPLSSLFGAKNSSSSVSTESVAASTDSNASASSSDSISSTDNSTSTSNSQSPDSNSNLPVVAAKKHNATTLPADFLKAYFTNNIDATGKCTDENVCGTNADPDADGLTNIDEYNYGTDPTKADSDSDGISDGDEVKVYGTDPTKKDSDGDSFEDGNEIITCFDPGIRTNNKFTSKRRNDIKTNVTTNKLHEPTVAFLKKAGAVDLDFAAGILEKTCVSGTAAVQ